MQTIFIKPCQHYFSSRSLASASELTNSNRGPFLAANQQQAPVLGGTEPICMLKSILNRLQAHAMIWAVMLAVMLVDDAAMLALAFC